MQHGQFGICLKVQIHANSVSSFFCFLFFLIFSKIRCNHSITECRFQRLIFQRGGKKHRNRDFEQSKHGFQRCVWLQPWLGKPWLNLLANTMTVHDESPYRCVVRKEFAKRSKKWWGGLASSFGLRLITREGPWEVCHVGPKYWI